MAALAKGLAGLLVRACEAAGVLSDASSGLAVEEVAST